MNSNAPAFRGLFRSAFSFSAAALAAAALLPHEAAAQLKWSMYAEKNQTVSGTAYLAGALMSATAATGGDSTTGTSATFTIPALSSVVFATSNFAPITLSASNTSGAVTFNFASTGNPYFTTAPTGTRLIAVGFLNEASATPSTLSNVGYYIDSKIAASGQIELFAPAAISTYNSDVPGSYGTGDIIFSNTNAQLSSSSTVGTPLVDNTTYTGKFMINYNATDVSSAGTAGSILLGTGNGLTTGAWVVTGPGTFTSWTADGTKYKVGTTPFPAPQTVNTFMLTYVNYTAIPVTITISNMTLVPLGPPTIQTPPTSTSTSVGGLATFSVTAIGNPTPTYQWYFGSTALQNGTQADESVITGATAPTLNLSNAQLDENGSNVYVVLTNIYGSPSSPTTGVTLSVTQQTTTPVITQAPSPSTVNAGQTATFTVAASGIPAPTFQWYFVPTGGSAVALSDGNGISGSQTATLSIAEASPIEVGSYYAVATNYVNSVPAGSATSPSATLTVINAGPSITAVTPTGSGAAACIDTPLNITFSDPVTLGSTGRIRIYNASTSALVDTIDLSLSPLTPAQIFSAAGIVAAEDSKTLEGQPFFYYPVVVNGATATIYPHQTLSYGTSYYVTIDTGVFVDTVTSNAFAGIFNSTTWAFATKASGPAPGTATLNVAADGSGDFCTVQGAVDSLPSGNSAAVTISIKNGTYYGLVFDTGRSNITFLGQSRTGVTLEYPNNNNLNSLGGSFYHRGAIEAYANNLNFVNLTIRNTTPHGGSQAEALILIGSQEIVSNVNLYSFQDTFQSTGSTYIGDSFIQGDVDFMWGYGANFFMNCHLTAATSSGYYTQIRNAQPSGTTNHGNVYLNCTLDALAGVTGSYLSRIDPTVGTGFPFSEVVYINCALGTNLNAAGWLLNNQTTAPSINWAYSGLTNAVGGGAYNTSGWSYAVPITNATTLQNYETPSYVLGGWNPQLTPIILIAPTASTIQTGQTATFSVTAAAVPEPTYQWFLNNVALSDGTQSDGSIVSGSATANLTIQQAGVDQGGANVTVQVSNTFTSVTTTAVTLGVTPLPPTITAQPAAQTAAVGGSASFSSAATGTSSYQWYHAGAAITGNSTATTPSLTVGSITPLNAGTYYMVATSSGGSTASSEAILNVTAGTGQPTLPVIPNGVFKVTAYGAVGDGATNSSAAFQAAVAAAITAGGGTVEVTPASGVYLTGPFTLGSNINFQVDAGAEVQALPYGTYPNVSNNPSNFLVTSNASNVEIVGGGTIDGNGSAWWTAFNNNSAVVRPQLVKFTGCSAVLVAGVTISNSPKENLFPNANNLTIDGITVSAPSTSPNTDGIDPSGVNILIENCSIADGDDDIAPKPQNVACSNIVITNCTIGSGHGISVGGQTNAGLNGMTVTNCSFTGGDYGLRLKADPTEGGPVQNLSYSGLTMTNVLYPIIFYSYYNSIGTPGATSGSSQTTPTKVNTWNTTPPASLSSTTIPTWTNITISNFTATGASGYSVIWGLPLANALFSNVTLNNVSITGGAGFEIYNANNVQFTGTTSVGTVITDNSLAITQQPQAQSTTVGSTISLSVTAAGASGITTTGPTFQWTFNGTPLANGLQADGSTVAGATTANLSISNAHLADSGSYAVTASNSLDGYNVSTSALVTNSLPVATTSSAVAVSVTDSESAFVTRAGLNPATTGAPGADPTGDGITNLMAFFLGGNPAIVNLGILPTSTYATVNNGPALIYSFNEYVGALPTVTAVVQYSTDLVNWTNAVNGVGGVVIATTPVNATTNQVTVTIPGGPQLYARLQVSQ